MFITLFAETEKYMYMFNFIKKYILNINNITNLVHWYRKVGEMAKI